ncbi:MAG: hypothetical protein BYD32DRAFT_408186 [Podila humilis]|nr:MAG: hypothetical protein BYD32DRAFT_408186 [Podila humilis]
MIGRADIEGSKSYVAMNACLPQDSYSSLRYIFWHLLLIRSRYLPFFLPSFSPPSSPLPPSSPSRQKTTDVVF